MKKKREPNLKSGMAGKCGISCIVGCLCLLFLVFVPQVMYAQVRKVSLEVKNVPLKQVLRMLGNEYGKDFFYSDVQVDMNEKVSVSFKDVTIDEALKRIFVNREVKFEEKENFVLILLIRELKPQQKVYELKGSVKDEKGVPLPGVTVRVKGANLGVATDKDGFFKLILGQRDTNLVVMFTFVGMETKEVNVKGDEELHVVMKEEHVNLKDVVVTGYANISRQSFTGNVTTMTAAELKKVSPVNVLKSIQVLDPSFRIAVNNEMGSNPNVLPEISIRGASGIGLTELDEANVSKTALQNNPNLPTFIMDGFEVSVSKVYDLDVNRIESITLLKDAAATAIYGSRAANGVVVITTVAPQEGDVLITYNFDMSVQVPNLDDYNLMDAREKLEAEKSAGLYGSGYADEITYQYKLRLLEQGVETDWLTKPLRNTVSGKHYLRMEGGMKGLRYGLDVNYQGTNGVMKGSERKYWGINFELQYNAGKFLFKNMAGFTNVNSEESPYGSFSAFTSLNPYYPYLDEDGGFLKTINIPYETPVANPLYDANLDSYNKSKTKEFTNNFSMQYHFSNSFYVKGNIALTYTTASTDIYTSPDAGKYATLPYKGEITQNNSTATSIDGGIFGYYNRVFDGHNINWVVGFNAKENTDESGSLYVRNLPEGGFFNPQFAREFPNAPKEMRQKTRLFGMLVSLNYTYNNIYLLDATYRLDGNSAFGSDKRFAPFWSGGVGMNLHNMNFMRRDWLSELKLRVSYGVTGKANFPANTARTVYTINGESVYPTGVGADIAAMGNRKLKWERTKITDVGGTMNLWNGLLVFNGNYYFRRTVDLIADMNIPASSGFLRYKSNIGEISNDGYELSLRVKAIGKPHTQLYIGGNLAANKNKIKKISEALKAYNREVEEKYQEEMKDVEAKKPLLKYVEGASTTSIYAMRSLGIDPQTGKELFRYHDGTVGSTWIASENVAVGNTEPKMNGTLSANLWHKGITLDLYFTYTYGGQQYNQTLQTKIENANLRKNVDKRVFSDRWKNPGDEVGFKSLEDWEMKTDPTSRFVQDDNTLTLQSLSLGYELPQTLLKKIYFTRVKFAFNMNDVFRISSIKQERGLSYPFARSFNFSVNVSF